MSRLRMVEPGWLRRSFEFASRYMEPFRTGDVIDPGNDEPLTLTAQMADALNKHLNQHRPAISSNEGGAG